MARDRQDGFFGSLNNAHDSIGNLPTEWHVLLRGQRESRYPYCSDPGKARTANVPAGGFPLTPWHIRCPRGDGGVCDAGARGRRCSSLASFS
jgi:hypothetical protein